MQRKVVSLKDLEDITQWKKLTIVKAVGPLLIRNKIRAVLKDNVRYFAINEKTL
jgi:hypothetical protein